MKGTRGILILVVSALILFIVSTFNGITLGLIKPGEFFPEISFDISQKKETQRYLIQKGAPRISIANIDADVVIVEVMSVYCVSCMAQAPFDRELFTMLEASDTSAGRVKMIGIGVGNNQVEVDKFVSKYSTPYPVFPDPDFSKYDQIGQVRTPFKIFLKKTDDTFQVIKTELGIHKNVAETFQTIINILEGRYTADKEVELAATERKSIDQGRVEGLMKEWLTRRGDTPRVERHFDDAGRIAYRIGSKGDLFAILIHRVSVCDVCKDIQFFYIIDSSGAVIDIVPIQLSKMYNAPFTEDDVAKIKGALVSKNITETIAYDSKVDAVSAATITTGIIYDSVNKGSSMYSLLKEKDFIR